MGINRLTIGGNNLSTTFSGQIAGGGFEGGSGGSLIKVGTGTLILAGSNTYSGGTTISGGVLQFNQPAAIAGTGPNVLVNAGGTAAAGYPIDQAFINRIAPGSQGVIALAVNSTNDLNFFTAGSFPGVGPFAGVGLIDVSLGAVGSATYGGTLTPAGFEFRLGGGGGTLTLTSRLIGAPSLLINPGGSAGVVVLDAANAYSGLRTEVAGGTLLVGDANSPTASISGTVYVDSGATLGGHGTINGNVANSGYLQPGGTIGVLTVSGNYTQASNGTLTIEITPNAAAGPGIGYDQLAVGGTASLAGALSVLDDAGTYRIGTRYTILTAAGGRTGSFVGVSYDPTFASYIDPVVSYDANDVYLTLAPTPAEITGGQEVPDMLTALASTAAGVGDTVLGDVCGAAAQRQANQGRGCVLHAFAAGYRSELWLRGIGGLGSLSGGGSLMDFRDSYGGMLLGGGIGRGGFTVGLGAGYVATTLSFSDGSGASQNAGVGFVYARYVQGPAWLGLMAAYGGGQVDGTRALPGTGLTASGNRPGDFAIVQGRAAYDLAVGTMTVQPTAALAYLHAAQSGFSETGSSLLDLSYGATSADEVAARLAARAIAASLPAAGC